VGAVHAEREIEALYLLSGILEDATFLNLTAATCARVLAPKLEGALNLARAACELDLPIVLVSSAAATLGSPGQAAYAAANAFLDALAAQLRAAGRSAASVALGPVAAVGMAAASGAAQRLGGRGVSVLEPAVAVSTLVSAWTRTRGSVVIVDLDVDRFVDVYPQVASLRCWQELTRTKSAQQRGQRGLLRSELGRLDAAQRESHLIDAVRALTAQVLQREPGAELELDTPFTDLGMDSLMGVELKNALEAALNLRLPTSLLWTYSNLRELAEGLAAKLELPTEPQLAAAPAHPAPDSAAALAALSDEQFAARMAAELAAEAES
jgi:acyl carrier protein